MKAYVYAIIVDGVPRYIGKGTTGRLRAHMRLVRSIARRRAAGETVRTSHFYNRLTKAWLGGADIQEIIIVDGLTDEQAYAREVAEIASAPEGQLWNCWAGGEGSSKGYTKSPDQRRKIADSNLRTWSDPQLLAEWASKMKIQWLKPEYREITLAALKEAHNAPARREALSAAAKARWADSAFREKMQRVHSDPVFKLRRSEATKRGWQTRRAAK